MQTAEPYKGGENFDLHQVLLRGQALRLRERTKLLGAFLANVSGRQENLTMRIVSSAADREVSVVDPYTGRARRMLMFGSNNYLGLANHPEVRARAIGALQQYGAGVGGPPLLNGYTALHRELEERLAWLKGTEDALLFSSGYGANVGLVTGLMHSTDFVLYDAYSHASFCDGLRMASVSSHRFRHSDVDALARLLEQRSGCEGDLFVGVEGVYSMDGDLAPLDLLVPLCASHGAHLIVDDAHGTGVMGQTGRGTAEFFGVEGKVDVTMGTFSKAFACTGGFVAASKPLVDYLRYVARAYMFSASLPPASVATVLAGIDVIQREPERLQQLRENVQHAATVLERCGVNPHPLAPILPLRVPVGMDIRRMAYLLHQRGIFLNSIEYPAVPVSQQRFRISIMATHTADDIRRMGEAVCEVWEEELGALARAS